MPVKWNIYVEHLSYCFKGIRVPKYGLNADFKREGETVTLEFTPEKEGTILFTCWMGMARGDIIVKEDLSDISEIKVEKKPGEAVLKIRGMCCSGCANYIQKLVMKMEGVESAKVSYEERKAIINYDPKKVSEEEIIKKIQSTGKYTAEN